MLAFLLFSIRGLDPLDALLDAKQPNCRDWAMAANAMIAQGEQSAIARLTMRSVPSKDVRKGLLCRILYVSRDKEPLRPPAFGGLDFVLLGKKSLAINDWPNLPMAEQDGVWFELSESYILGGFPEPLAWYMDYCRKDGNFRRKPIEVPTATEAERSLAHLLESPRWLALGPKDKNYAWVPILDRLRVQILF